MANEITYSVSVTGTKNGVTFHQALASTVDMAGDEMIQNVQQVGASTEALVVGDVSTIGLVMVKNLDDTNYVELSTDNANANKFMKLRPGTFALFPASSATIYATANTATCKVMVLALEL
jgi:hypothetical protein